MKLHTTKQVEEAAGVSYRTLRRWVREGLLEQPARTSDGRSGVHLRWTAAQLRRGSAGGQASSPGLGVLADRRAAATQVAG